MRLGIDIGTHTARAAYLDAGGAPRLVRFADGSDTLPAMARQTMHALIVGAEAADALVGNAETTLCGCTRLMGRAASLSPALLARLPHPVRDASGEAICDLLYAEVRPAEVYGRIVRALVDAAERESGQPVDGVVLAVPAGAEDRFRVQARAAAERQGVTVRRLVNQPAAALLALDQAATNGERPPAITQAAPWAAALRPSSRLAVVSCGGGSTEVSIAERGPDGWRVLATVADPLLGGDEFVWAGVERLNQRFRDEAGLDVLAIGDSRVAAAGLRAAAEHGLRQLSVAPEVTLVIDHGGGFGRDLVAPLSRAEADRCLRPTMDRLADICARALAAGATGSRGNARRLDGALLIGDWAFLPQIQTSVAGALRLAAGQIWRTRPETLAAEGAALLAAGAAGAVWDVTPYPLGINCYFGEEELLSPIIPANTPIPTTVAGAHTQSYSTRFPDQRDVQLAVLQYRGAQDGNPYGPGRVRPDECERLGSWTFTGLSPKRGACAAFTVTFAVDADGVLSLEARETATGRTLSARVDRGVG